MPQRTAPPLARFRARSISACSTIPHPIDRPLLRGQRASGEARPRRRRAGERAAPAATATQTSASRCAGKARPPTAYGELDLGSQPTVDANIQTEAPLPQKEAVEEALPVSQRTSGAPASTEVLLAPCPPGGRPHAPATGGGREAVASGARVPRASHPRDRGRRVASAHQARCVRVPDARRHAPREGLQGVRRFAVGGRSKARRQGRVPRGTRGRRRSVRRPLAHAARVGAHGVRRLRRVRLRDALRGRRRPQREGEALPRGHRCKAGGPVPRRRAGGAGRRRRELRERTQGARGREQARSRRSHPTRHRAAAGRSGAPRQRPEGREGGVRRCREARRDGAGPLRSRARRDNVRARLGYARHGERVRRDARRDAAPPGCAAPPRARALPGEGRRHGRPRGPRGGDGWPRQALRIHDRDRAGVCEPRAHLPREWTRR